jgi:hypothetical protein
MFLSLLAHLQKAQNKRHLVYCLRVMSVGCYQDWSGDTLLGLFKKVIGYVDLFGADDVALHRIYSALLVKGSASFRILFCLHLENSKLC